jgi:ankyrin repeat protein
MLKAGADPNIKDAEGKSALQYAVEHNAEEAAQILRDAGAQS